MKDKIYLIANASGVVRHTKRYPSMSRDEIAVAVTIAIPDSAFRSPVLSVALDVPDGHVIQPTVELNSVEEIEE